MAFLEKIDNPGDIQSVLDSKAYFQHLRAFTKALNSSDSGLSNADKELIVAYVSYLNKCEYAFTLHSEMAKELGIDPSIYDRLDDINSAPVEDSLKPVLQLVQKITQSSSQVLASDIEAIKLQGWSEDDIIDIITFSATMNLINRLLSGHGIPKMAPEKNRSRALELVKAKAEKNV